MGQRIRIRTVVGSLGALLVIAVGCSRREASSVGWDGQVDSLADGHVAVRNESRGLWTPRTAWKVVEDLRIGSIDARGPESFGRVTALAVDAMFRIWVLDMDALELQVFGPDGAYVRTVGRRGGGPGEFAHPVRVDVSPTGDIWVMDPQNNRVSVFDSSGSYVEGKTVAGGFVIMPWPGGFDASGSYYAPVVSFEPEFHMALGRFDTRLNPLDTLILPTDPNTRDAFTIVSDGRIRVSAGVPFEGGLVWRLSRGGTIWALITDQYRMFELSGEGDTLRTVTKAHSLLPVTSQEKEQALDGLKWFTDQGGRVDLSRIPDHKPPVSSFFVDEDGDVWVMHTPSEADTTRSFDVFNAEGQYLGVVDVPMRLQLSPLPFIHDGELYGVASDSLGVQYVVRARVVKAGNR